MGHYYVQTNESSDCALAGRHGNEVFLASTRYQSQGSDAEPGKRLLELPP